MRRRIIFGSAVAVAVAATGVVVHTVRGIGNAVADGLNQGLTS